MLTVDKVGAAYGISPVLTDVTLEVRAGEAVTLLGRNGVGKTTLLRTIAGLHHPTAGRLMFEDADITRMSAHQRARRSIALVPQGRGIFPHLTVEQNLLLGLSALVDRKETSQQMPAYIYEMFPALARMRLRRGGVLSGGEQQQLAIGRALACRPKLLMLDEPTEGIQPSIVQEIARALTRICTELKIAVLLVEQYLDFAWLIADRYYVMQRGRVVTSGSTRSESPDTVAHLLSV